jgi:hypothetical protein
MPEVELSRSISLLSTLIQNSEAMGNQDKRKGKGKLHKCSLEELSKARGSCLTIAELEEMGLDGTPWSVEMVRIDK